MLQRHYLTTLSWMLQFCNSVFSSFESQIGGMFWFCFKVLISQFGILASLITSLVGMESISTKQWLHCIHILSDTLFLLWLRGFKTVPVDWSGLMWVRTNCWHKQLVWVMRYGLVRTPDKIMASSHELVLHALDLHIL